MMKKIKTAFEDSKTVDKIWVTTLIIGCLLILYFIWKNPISSEKLKTINQEQYEDVEEDELMM